MVAPPSSYGADGLIDQAGGRQRAGGQPGRLARTYEAASVELSGPDVSPGSAQ